jgi:TRAP-type C4-dicarboxylate transport system permease small subunit
MAETFHRINDRLYQFCIWVSAISIVVMSIIIPWGIFARYVLGTGSRWPEPVAILLMVLFTFLGSAVSYRAGAHIAVAMLTDRLPEGVARPLRVVIHLLMLSVALFMLYYGTTLCIGTWHQTIGELPWMPVGLTYTPVPMAGFITTLFVVEVLLFGSQKQREVITLDHLSEDAERA